MAFRHDPTACRRLHHLKVPLPPQIELPKGEPIGDIFKTVAPLDIWGLSVFICINHMIRVLWHCLQVSGTTGCETAQSSAQCIYFLLFSTVYLFPIVSLTTNCKLPPILTFPVSPCWNRKSTVPLTSLKLRSGQGHLLLQF